LVPIRKPVTDVAFHFNVGERSNYACRLLRKAYLKGSRLLVRVDVPDLHSLDQALWVMGAGDFVPHARDSDPVEVRRHSPILIASQEAEGFAADVLVNLGADVPGGADRFDRVIEIVGSEPQERQAARQRWKRYQAMGLEPRALDLTEPRVK
jgi:DNA polymerase III subunit chi